MTTKCGVLGIYNFTPNYCNIIDFIDSLDKLQHRGQEGAGICYYNYLFNIYKNKGLVKDVFKNINENYSEIETKIIIGHTRYSTSGSKNKDELQPFLGINRKLGQFSFCFNGNIPYTKQYSNYFPNYKYNKDTYLDTDFIRECFETDFYSSWEELFIDFIKKVDRAYCILVIANEKLYVLRDSYDVRPLCYGEKDGNICVASESCALLKYDYVRPIKPGECLCISNGTIKSLNTNSIKYTATCIFEYIYFLNEKSTNVSYIRSQFGELLGSLDEDFKDKDYIVCGTPSSGILSAQAYAKYLNIRYEQFIEKNPKSNRTFILENNVKRNAASKNKYNIVGNIKGKNLIIIDDSIVRGITMKNLISKLWTYEPNSIHVRVAAPPIKYPCFYGVDIPTYDELIAHARTEKTICNMLNCSSLKYIKIEDLYKIFPKNNTCFGCFNQNYINKINDW